MSDDSSVTSSAAAAAEHEHLDTEALHGSVEQAVMYLVSGVGLSANAALLAAVLLQPHTRRLSSAFLVHACLLNSVLSAYCVVFARGLRAGVVAASSCNSLGTSYVVLMTVSVFNLVAAVCCEVYLFDNCPSVVKKRPKGSLCCVLFGTVLVYTGSIILHLGPTLIGANFEPSEAKRCLFVYGQVKNYIVYTMWILIVSLALAAAAYYLAVFHKVIGKTVQAKLIILSSQQEELPVSMDAVDRKLDSLANIKRNRQRVLSAVCGLHFICWYPLFLLILVDPQYQVSAQLYKLLTILGFARAALEPLVVLAFDRSANHLVTRCLPCATTMPLSTEDEINRWMLAVDSAAAAGNSAGGKGRFAVASSSSPQPQATTGEGSSCVGSVNEIDDDALAADDTPANSDYFEQRRRRQGQAACVRSSLHHRPNRQASFDESSVGGQSFSAEGLPAFAQLPPPPPPPPPLLPPQQLPTSSSQSLGPAIVSSGWQQMPAEGGLHYHYQQHQHHFPAVPIRPQAAYPRTLAYSPITRV